MEQKESIAASFSNSAFRGRIGATRTRSGIYRFCNRFEKFALSQNWHNITPSSITVKQVRKFVQHRVMQQANPRTIQNEVSLLRRSIIGAGRGTLLTKALFSSARLGVPAGSRIGKGKAVDRELLEQARPNLQSQFMAGVDLQLELGLRMNEVIMCDSQLPVWLLELTEKGASFVTVSKGTKGGKMRDIAILPSHRERCVKAIRTALTLTNQGKDFLIQSKTLRGACEKYRAHLSKVNLRGENSSHSLRRAFAVRQYHVYLSDGHSEQETLRKLSRDLGHGDGRGRWVFNNYLRNSLPNN